MDTYLIGYGTLLHTGSLGHSIGQEAARAKRIVPIIVPGYRRLFNIRPTHYESSHKLSKRGNENGAANVEMAADCRFNALGFSVDSAELARLDEREKYYQRQEVPILHFDTHETLGRGHVYTAAYDSPHIERTNHALMPLWRDVVWARTGAYRISATFGQMFDATTYLADGATLVADHYRSVLDDSTDVEMPE